ncbi:MAG: carboxypeptidase regulatory-like domain-containing protein [Deltaproteobacteria bacterium]|nr:carboxypeptidase regulatory-like domain-containing protein [Deltaproteobacteria bacterium]
MIRALALLAAGLAGCQLIIRDTQSPECRTNTECVTGQICFFRECVAPLRDAAADLFVEVAPPARLTLPPQQKAFTAPRGRATVEWKQPTLWKGTIRDLAVGFRIHGLLTFNRAALIPGRPISFAARAPEGAPFSIELEPGAYTVTLVPNADLQRAPLRLEEAWNVTEIDNFDVSIPYPTSFSTISGRLTTTPSDLIFPGFEGATVFAKLKGQPLTSTVATTRADGSFDLVIFGVGGEFSLFVAPSNQNASLPQIEFTKGSNGMPLVLSRATALKDVYLGDVGSPVIVAGTVLNADLQPEPNVSISAEAAMLGGVYRTGTTSDKNGKFALKLLRGEASTELTYAINATALASSSRGRAALIYTLETTGEPAPIALSLGERLPVNGYVVDASGQRVAAMNIVAKSNDGGATVPAVSRDDGTFDFFLDPGEYAFALVPPSGARLPRTTIRATIDATSNPLELVLPPVALVGGEVTTFGDKRMSGAILEFYRVIGDGAELVGQASVDDKNHFSVALPAE